MKKILVAATILLSLTSAFSAFAQDSTKGAVGAKTADPNEEMNRDGSGVAVVGECKECLARLKHGRLGDQTTAQPSGTSGQSSGSSKTTNGVE